MSRINTSRVILGGLAAGVVINASEFLLNMVVLETRWRDALAALHVTPADAVAVIAGLYLCGFLGGIVTVWLYAAIRPRYGRGWRAALIAGFAVWILGYFLATAYPVLMGLIPLRLGEIGLLWGLPEILLASMVGARLYQEEEVEAGREFASAAAGR